MVNIKEAAPESEGMYFQLYYLFPRANTKEQKIKQKCSELKKRIQEVEECNEVSLLALSRTRASIRRSRIQHAVLLERLQDRLSSTSSAEPNRPWLPAYLDDNFTSKKNSGPPNSSVLGSKDKVDNPQSREIFDYFKFTEGKQYQSLSEEAKHEILRNKWNQMSSEERCTIAKKFELEQCETRENHICESNEVEQKNTESEDEFASREVEREIRARENS